MTPGNDQRQTGRLIGKKGVIMNKEVLKEKLKAFLPPYAVVALSILIVSNLGVYYGARLINELLDRPYLDMTGAIDRAIPVIPAFSIIYVAAFPFWYVTYFVICRSNRERCIRLVSADVAAKLLCGVLFILIPTTNVRPVLADSGFGNWLLGLIYASDAPDNLFPSIHCLESWMCYLAIRNEEKVPVWVKDSALILALLICLATLFTKQHVLVDALAGLVIADGVWCMSDPEYVHSLRFRHQLLR